MGTILRIFVNDVVSIGRRFFALAIIVAISILPALYAWVNIYANGNPYTNTGNIRIAVASEDPGVTLVTSYLPQCSVRKSCLWKT